MLEDTHPVPRVRRQAANLRYIIEAPKLELGPDERVSIPVLKEVERKKCAPICPLDSLNRETKRRAPRLLSSVVAGAEGDRAQDVRPLACSRAALE